MRRSRHRWDLCMSPSAPNQATNKWMQQFWQTAQQAKWNPASKWKPCNNCFIIWVLILTQIRIGESHDPMRVWQTDRQTDKPCWFPNSLDTKNYLRKLALNWNIFSWGFVWKQDIVRCIINWQRHDEIRQHWSNVRIWWDVTMDVDLSNMERSHADPWFR